MVSLIFSFLSSFLVALIIIKYKNTPHLQFMADYEIESVQKHHDIPVPRTGGLAILLGLLTGIAIKQYSEPNVTDYFYYLLSSIPAFVIGFLEDVTKNITITIRFICLGISGFLAITILKINITSVGIPWVDYLFALSPISVLFTVIAISGLANAYNIIDGFNGLASMVGIISLIALGYVSFITGDNPHLLLSLIGISAILGFFVWNYPNGQIFLGDGGAYLIGFWISLISISLAMKHNEISPWFAFLVNGYPIIETLFTIYRRKIQRNKNPGFADAIHLHTLIFRRVLMLNSNSQNLNKINSGTSPYLWILSSLGVIPAVIFWNSSIALMIGTIMYLLLYIFIYNLIIKFKTPGWLHMIARSGK